MILPHPSRRIWLFLDHEAIATTLVQHNDKLKKSFDYQLLTDILGDGLITTEGAVWEEDRSRLQPAFKPAANAAFLPIMQKRIDAYMDTLKVGEERDLYQDSLAITLGVIGERMFYRNVDEHMQRIVTALAHCLGSITVRGALPVDLPKRYPKIFARRFVRELATLRGIIAELMDERRGSTEPFDMNAMMQKDPAFSRERMVNHLLTMFSAGYETTASALGWMWMLVAERPALQELVRGADDSVLRAVCDESLRLYPSLPTFGREVTAPFQIDDIALVPGDSIGYCPYATHRLEAHFHDPDRFDHTRFLRVEGKPPPKKGSYLPFALGQRACIGASFALTEMQLVLGSMLKRFRLELVDPPERAALRVSYAPHPGVIVKLLPTA
ncbi:MAG: cytochrome P450 [Deltaproteobacteria bacterium]|nr:cytochrome P450 [Deltaproteobacteria bacterium]